VVSSLTSRHCSLMMVWSRRAAPLFPSTALFRSREETAQGKDPRTKVIGVLNAFPFQGPGHRLRGKHIILPKGHGHKGHQDRDSLNRKSTRLNSSHVKISYAVFCSKKKSVTSAK